MSLTLGIYGKLPVSKEYFRLHCFRGVGGEFRKWVDQGFEHATRQSRGRSYSLGGRWRLLWYPDGFADAVVATLRDSADMGGKRAFPFTCFATVPKEDLAGLDSGRIEQLWPLWQDMERADDELGLLDEAGALQDRAKTCSLGELPAPPVEALALADSLDAFAQGLALAENAREGVKKQALWPLWQACLTLDSKKIAGARIPGLRLPLAAGLEPLGQCIAWLRCLEAGGFLDRPVPVSIAIPARVEAGAYFWVFIRPPLPQDYWSLGAQAEGLMVPDPGIAPKRETVLLARKRFFARVDRDLFGADATLAALAAFPVRVPEDEEEA